MDSRKETINTKVGIRQEEFLEFTPKLGFLVVAGQMLPRVTPPEGWDAKGCNSQGESILKECALGHTRGTLSTELIETVNMIQRKPFVINEEALELLGQFRSGRKPRQAELVGIPTGERIAATEAELEKLKRWLPGKQRLSKLQAILKCVQEIVVTSGRNQFALDGLYGAYRYLQRGRALVSKGLFAESLSKKGDGGQLSQMSMLELRELVDRRLCKEPARSTLLTILAAQVLFKESNLHRIFVWLAARSKESKADRVGALLFQDKWMARVVRGYRRQKMLEKELQALRDKGRFTDLALRFGEVFRGIKLYYTTVLDYRGRMYPKEWLFSRTSGVFKYVLEDARPLALNVEGLQAALKAYYTFWPKKLKSLQRRGHISFRGLVKFFYSNPVPYVKAKNLFYFLLLEKAIQQGVVTKKFAFSIEVDQSCSVAVILSLFFKNPKFAEHANLLGGAVQSVYQRVQELLIKKLDTRISAGVLTAFRTTRDLTKLPTMSFFYNQTAYGRLVYWQDTLQELGVALSSADYKALRSLAERFPQYIEELFPGLVHATGKLNKLFLKICKLDPT